VKHYGIEDLAIPVFVRGSRCIIGVDSTKPLAAKFSRSIPSRGIPGAMSTPIT
jgi:hypothetical protein